jgi:hypothetical protein
MHLYGASCDPEERLLLLLLMAGVGLHSMMMMIKMVELVM